MEATLASKYRPRGKLVRGSYFVPWKTVYIITQTPLFQSCKMLFSPQARWRIPIDVSAERHAGRSDA